MTTPILEANLAALARHNTRLVERLRCTAASPRCAFAPTPQGVPALSLDKTQMCSRHRPLDEADRFVAGIDIIEHAAIVVLGFAAGYHVQRLAQRVRKTSLVIVFEPDLALLRAVLEQVDHSTWINETNITIIADAADRAAMAAQLAGAEGIVAQGTTIQPHLPSRPRLGESASVFSRTFADLVGTIRTTMLTTLVHSSTTCRNLCLNLDQYAAGEGIAPLQGIARGRTALLIAAGPSLVRHYDLLTDPALRRRVVLIAAQTCLRPLLRRGIRPHFVTALDYHEISRHFYDDLDPDDLRDITLVCEPKVNRVVVESYPGPIRCVGNPFLDRVLGPLKREMGSLTAGSTVAHLSFYLAQHLGCDPIVLLGQDLGFTDGLYYGPGAAIHDQWAPEVNPFNTIDMMEWSRVARMKRNLREARDRAGRPVLTDEQMSTYLTQFERDFSTAPQTIIDAGGGVAKQHTIPRPLESVLAEASTAPLPEFTSGRTTLDSHRLGRVRGRVESLRADVSRLEDVSRATAEILAEMLDHQRDAAAMSRLFRRIDANQKQVQRLAPVHDLVNLVNQLGVFKRLKADRRLELIDSLDAVARQKAQLERDQSNVHWLAEACVETGRIFDEAVKIFNGESVSTRISEHAAAEQREPDDAAAQPRRVAAMVAVDPEHSGLLLPRSLDTDFAGRSILQATLERLGRCRRIESIILIVPRGCDVNSFIDRSHIDRPIIIREINGPIYDQAHRSIAIARRWSDWSWRGGIGGMSVYDEITTPTHMAAAMDDLHLDAALIVGPDWPLLDWTEQTGCDALVSRYIEHPESHRLVFTQAPPGLCGILIETSLMREMAQRSRQFTIGSMLSYIPSLPQLDPISKDACVKLPAEIRNVAARFIAEGDEACGRLCESARALRNELHNVSGIATLQAFEAPLRAPDSLPQQIEIELTTRRSTSPFWLAAPLAPLDLGLDLLRHIAEHAASRADLTVTFAGRGDPLLHPHFERALRVVRDAGCTSIHLRTDLPESFGDPARLIDLPIDVISVELHAESAPVYRAIMGVDRFDLLRQRLDDLINARNERRGSGNVLTLPWIVPHLVRCEASIGEMRNFFDRWVHYVGAAAIDGVPIHSADASIQLDPPPASLAEMNRRILQVRADGSAFVGPSAWIEPDQTATADLNDTPLAQAWASLQSRITPVGPAQETPTLILELDAA